MSHATDIASTAGANLMIGKMLFGALLAAGASRIAGLDRAAQPHPIYAASTVNDGYGDAINPEFSATEGSLVYGAWARSTKGVDHYKAGL